MKDTLIFTMKAYDKDEQFARDVMSTQSEANSIDHHIELISKLYPEYTVDRLYTYQHGGLVIERSPSCRWDSALDGMCAYKNEQDLDNYISEINSDLLYEENPEIYDYDDCTEAKDCLEPQCEAKVAIERLTNMLEWSDRIGSDEIAEIRKIIDILDK